MMVASEMDRNKGRVDWIYLTEIITWEVSLMISFLEVVVLFGNQIKLFYLIMKVNYIMGKNMVEGN